MMREAMRQGLPKAVHQDIASRVRKSLESEPSYLLPSTQRSQQSFSSKTTHAPAKMVDFKKRAVTGLAMAASVVMVVGAVVVRLNQPTVAVEESASVVAQRSIAVPTIAQSNASSVTTVSVHPAPLYQASATNLPTQSGQVWDHLPVQQGLSMDEYLFDHSSYSENNTMRGILPYARVVGYSSQGNQ